jgi:hypothetical protein
MLAYDRWHIFTVKLSRANITVNKTQPQYTQLCCRQNTWPVSIVRLTLKGIQLQKISTLIFYD